MDQMEVLASCLCHNARVAFVLALCYATRDLPVQFPEDRGASGVMGTGKLPMREDHLGNFLSIAGDELNDPARHSSFEEDLVNQVIGGHRGWPRLPYNHIAHQRRRTGHVATNHRTVKRPDRIDN